MSPPSKATTTQHPLVEVVVEGVAPSGRGAQRIARGARVDEEEAAEGVAVAVADGDAAIDVLGGTLFPFVFLNRFVFE